MSTEHKLAAILFADIAGYTAIMQRDEKTALQMLERFRNVLEEVTPLHSGTIVQYFGDGCLLSFESSTKCVDAAIHIQNKLRVAPQVPVRIGIHLGDVVFEKNNVFGDGVNIASRIESLGVPGAILLSKTIRDQIKNKSEYLLVSVGSFDFKNVSELMEVFAVANDGFVVPKRTEMQGKLKAATKTPPKLKWFASIGVIVIALGLLFASWNILFQKKPIERSIAVLPFVDMSQTRDQEYFGDGLSEELINVLAQVPELEVTGRTSSFSFKGKNTDLRVIGKELGVAHLLEGSVRKSGNMVRVTVQLIRTSDGTHLWSQTYDRQMEDILKLQDEIATVVGKQLKIKLIPFKEKQSLTSTKQEVYDLILHGNYFLEKRDRESQAKARDLYEQALRLDSTNAASWANLAKCYTLQSTWDWIDHSTGYLDAESAAQKALQLDPQNAVAFRSLGSVYMYRLKWKESENYFDRALELEPGYADAMRLKGLLFWAIGRYGEAKRLLLKSIDLDPLKPIAYMNLGLVYFHSGQNKQAVASYRKALEIDPKFPRAHGMTGAVYLTTGEFDLAAKEQAAEGDGILGKASYHSALGNKQESDIYLKQLIEQSSRKPFRVARVYAIRGEKDKVFEWLEKSLQVGDPNLIFFKNNPFFKRYRDDPQYKAFEKKMNFPAE